MEGGVSPPRETGASVGARSSPLKLAFGGREVTDRRRGVARPGAKYIADAADRADERRRSGKVDLLAQPRDQRVDRTVKIGPRPTPQYAGQLGARHRPAWMANKGDEQVEFR